MQIAIVAILKKWSKIRCMEMEKSAKDRRKARDHKEKIFFIKEIVGSKSEKEKN